LTWREKTVRLINQERHSTLLSWHDVGNVLQK